MLQQETGAHAFPGVTVAGEGGRGGGEGGQCVLGERNVASEHLPSPAARKPRPFCGQGAAWRGACGCALGVCRCRAGVGVSPPPASLRLSLSLALRTGLVRFSRADIRNPGAGPAREASDSRRKASHVKDPFPPPNLFYNKSNF